MQDGRDARRTATARAMPVMTLSPMFTHNLVTAPSAARAPTAGRPPRRPRRQG
ncbi:hypothetical protein LV779_13975 [Streptomyces thinghirensis]|nr:hypothetical protein [Streptomyces thinghirensis]